MTNQTTTCPKCLGKKYFESYGHIVGGVCFRCNGQGIVKVSKPRKASAPKTIETKSCWIACHPNPAFCASEAYESKEDAMHAASMRTGWIVKEGEYNAKSIRPAGWFGKVA